LTATYVGRTAGGFCGKTLLPPGLVKGSQQVAAIRNAGFSHYNALQVEFQRRTAQSLQALMSSNLAKSSDLDSSDLNGFTSASGTGWRFHR
jgi:hypothetical protein